MPKRTINELDKAEEKFDALITKRNMLNDEANELRQVRDMLNDQKRKLLDETLDTKKEKDAKVAEMGIHKRKRNELNAKAKELIQLKRQLHQNTPDTEMYREIDRLNREFEFLEMKQQTDTLSVQEENEVIQKMRFNFAERNRLLAVTRKGEEFFSKLEEANVQIDRIFDEARKEHEAVTSLYREVQAFGEQMNAKMNEASILIGEADRKHAEFVKKREEADACHYQAMEMRSFILEQRKERREKAMESRKALQEQNFSVRKTLFDKKASEEEADKQLQELMKRGKISLR
jgi:uncharacterized coiled-coil DUF342 family protein